MTTKTLTQHMAEVSQESIVNDAPRQFDDFPVGSVSHQGDVILVAIAGLPTGAKVRTNRQVADGTTQGSRHILEGGDHLLNLINDMLDLGRIETGKLAVTLESVPLAVAMAKPNPDVRRTISSPQADRSKIASSTSSRRRDRSNSK